MRSGQLFWGFFFLTIGGLYFLTKYDVIVSDFSFVWDIWPLIFILWGLAVITKHSIGRPVVSALFGIFIGLMAFGLFYNFFGTLNIHNKNHRFVSERYSQEFDRNIKVAALELNTGAGMVSINGTTDKLIEGYSRGALGEYDMFYTKDDSSAKVKMNLHKRSLNFFRSGLKNYLGLRLNPQPDWDIELNMGAAKAELDLSDYKLRDLQINTGASNLRIKLGDKTERLVVDVEMGAASLTLEVPQNTGCEIHTDMALASKSIQGFTSKGKGHYITDNFDESSKRILINVKGGVSSITVNRY